MATPNEIALLERIVALHYDVYRRACETPPNYVAAVDKDQLEIDWRLAQLDLERVAPQESPAVTEPSNMGD